MGGKTSTSTSQVSIPPEVLARYSSVNATAEQAASAPFQTYSNNPNAFVAPMTSTQTAGEANTNAAAGMAQPYFQAGTGFALAGAQPVNAQPLDTGAYMNPYLNTVLGSTAALINQNNATAMANQTGSAINQGYFGGDRSGIAAAVLQGQQNLAAGQVYSGIASDAYNQALQAAMQQQGVGLSAAQANRAALQQTGQSLAELGTGAQGAALSGAQAQLGAGQVEQQTQQAGLTALYNQFLQEQSFPFQKAQFLANIAEGTGALSGNTTTTTQPQSIFSDERLKEDIEPIGKGFDGANIIRFRYRGDPTTRIGMSAQDVERRHPEAVSEHGGFKAVDYGAATDDAAARGGFGRAANDDYPDERQHRQVGGMSAMASYPPGVNPWSISELLQSQAQMYAPFSQSGLYGGSASGAPHGGSSYIPNSTLPVPMPIHGTPPPQQSQTNPIHQIAQEATDLKSMGEMGQKGSHWLSNQKWSPTYKASEHMDDPSTVAPTSTANPKLDEAAAAAVHPDIDTTSAPDVHMDDSGNLISDLARGGFARAHRDMGGGFDPSDPHDDNPYQPQGPGLNIPTTETQHQQLQPAKPPGQGQSGLMQGLQAGADIASIAKLAMMFANRGGQVRRHGYATDGSVDDDQGTGGGDTALAQPVSRGLSAMENWYEKSGIPQTIQGQLNPANWPAVKGEEWVRKQVSDVPGAWSTIAGTMMGPVGPIARAVSPPPHGQPAPSPAAAAPAGAPPVGAVDRNIGPQVTTLRNWGVRSPNAPAPASGAPGGPSGPSRHPRGGGTFRPAPAPAAAPGAISGPPGVSTTAGGDLSTGVNDTTVGGFGAAAAPAAAPNRAAIDAASGFGGASANVPGFGMPAGDTAAAVAGAPTNVPGFGNAAPSSRELIDQGAVTPHAVQHAGGPPLPTVDAQGNPVTPGAVQHDQGFGPAANTQGTGPGGASPPAAVHQGGFGGIVQGVEHLLGAPLGLLGGMVGYHPEGGQGADGKGHWDMNQLVPFLNFVGAVGSTPTVHPLFALSQGLQAYGQAYQARETQQSNIMAQQLDAMNANIPDNLRQAGVVVRPGPGAANQETIPGFGKQWHYEYGYQSLPGEAPGANVPPTTNGAGQPSAATVPEGAAPAPVAAPAARREMITPNYENGTYDIGPSADADKWLADQGIPTPPSTVQPRDRQYWGQAQLGSHNMQVRDAEDRATLNALPSDPDLRTAKNLNMAMVDAFGKLATEGLSAPGAMFPERQTVANFVETGRNIVNGAADAIGHPELRIGANATVQDIINAGSELDKIRARIGPQTAAGFGQHSAHIADILTNLSPGAQYQPEAARTVMAQLIMQTQSAWDERRYGQRYFGDRGFYAGAPAAFEHEYGARQDHEMREIPDMLTPRGDKKQSPVAVLRANSDNPRVIKAFDDRYGPGASRIWLQRD